MEEVVVVPVLDSPQLLISRRLFVASLSPFFWFGVEFFASCDNLMFLFVKEEKPRPPTQKRLYLF